MCRPLFTVVSLVAVFAASFLIFGSFAGSASASHAGGMDAMSIDMDPTLSPGNSATSVGSRQVQARLNENDVMDADEDLVDSLVIDITATRIPASNPMILYNFDLSYSSPPSPDLCVVGRDYHWLLATAGPLADAGTGVPVCFTSWSGGALSLLGGVSGSGVLERLTLQSKPGVATGVFDLTLEQAIGVDEEGQPQLPDVVNNAAICINTECPDADGDGIEVPDDACPTFAGPPENDGCPLAGPPAVGGIAGLLERSDVDAASADGGGASAPVAALAALGGAALVAVASGFGFALRRIR